MNLSSSVKKFVSNKNTITIIGVILCIVILYVGYNIRINQKVALSKVPYANQTIQPKTEITNDMISFMNVPASFIKGSYYSASDEIVGKYSKSDVMIAEGSLFYTEFLTDKANDNSSMFGNVGSNETVISYNVDMNSTYANSMMPDDVINVYFKAKGDDGTIMFGKFLSNIKILDIKDSDGQRVFENTNESRTPAYLLFALPEDMHLLFRKALYLSNSYEVELILVPNTKKLDKNDVVNVSSKDIQDFINDKTKMVSVDEILSSTEDKVNTDKDSLDNNNSNSTDSTKKDNSSVEGNE